MTQRERAKGQVLKESKSQIYLANGLSALQVVGEASDFDGAESQQTHLERSWGLQP